MPEQPPETKTLVKRLKTMRDSAKAERSNWDDHWQEIADLVAPTRDFNVKRHEGEQRRFKIYDSTACEAHQDLASRMHGLLTNPSIRWFGMALQAHEGGIDDSVSEEEQAWLYDVSSIGLSVFNNPRFGFATNSYEIYLDQASFGMGVMLVQEKPNGIFFQARQLSNFWRVDSEDGQLETEFIEFEMRPREVVERWGESGVSDKMLQMSKSESGQNEKVTILHVISRRSQRNPLRADQKNKPWASYYVENQTDHLLSEGGFDDNPYLAPRWSRAAQETYGRSPAMQVLPTIKTLNARVRTNLVAGELATRPPIMYPANSIQGQLLVQPGALIPYKASTRDKPSAFDTGARPDTGIALIEEDRQAVRRAFMLDAFELPDRDRMTATEIIERRQLGLLRSSPMLSRQYEEWLTPLVSRVYRHLLRRRMLPPPPASMDGRMLTVDYTSPMALSQRASEVQAFTQAMTAAIPLVNSDPTLMQTEINGSEALRQIFSMNNVNPRFLNKRPVAEQKRAAIEQMAQAQAQAQTAESAAKAVRDSAAGAKDLGETPILGLAG